MGCLDKNLNCIKEKNKKLYEEIIHWLNKLKNNELDKKFKLINTKDNKKTIEVCLDNKSSIRLNSIYNSKKEAERWNKKYDVYDRVTSLIMFGCGNCIFFDEVKKKLDLDAVVFVYEPDIELFYFCLKEFDMTLLLSDLRVKIYINQINGDGFYMDLCNTINWSMLSTQIVCFHPLYNKIYADEYYKFKKIIDNFKYALEISKNTSLYHAKEFTENIIRNIRFIKGSNIVDDFIGKISYDIPVIIVSAGPSLDKNISELKKAQGKAFVLATDTAVKYLLQNGIYFDAIVTIDGSKPLEYVNDVKCKDKCIFTILDANYEILKQNSGRKVWINGSGILEKIYKKYGISFETYQSGGSVATAAFEIARILKSKVVILVGQDLAYLGDNTHAGGIAERISDGDSLFVEDIYGGQIRTRNDWLRYLQWFEAAAKQLEGQIKIIDATEGGAKIQGTMIMRLQDAIAKYCRKAFCFEDILNEMEPTFSNARYCNIYKDILKIRDELETIKKNSKKGSEYSCIIMSCIKEKRITNKEYHEYINQLNMLKENVQKQNVYMLLDEYISEDVSERLSMLSVRYNDENEYFYESAKSNKILFQALEKSVRELSPLLNETLRNM